jgi:cephalosporin hydroxylase
MDGNALIIAFSCENGYEVQSDFAIKIDSRYGGNTKYFANIMDLIGNEEVISIDFDRHPKGILEAYLLR